MNDPSWPAEPWNAYPAAAASQQPQGPYEPPLPPTNFGPPAGPPAQYGPPGGPGAPIPPRATYEGWTRQPVLYLPVMRRGEFMGCLWASVTHNSAGFIRKMSGGDPLSDPSWTAIDTWADRLAAAYADRLPAQQAIQQWIGAPEHPEGGGISVDTQVQQVESLAALYELVNPGGPPPPNPLVQDGMYPDGTPVDRSQGWGPLVSAPLRRYATTTSSAVRYLPIVKEGRHIGYLWASVDNDAADYLPLHSAGKTAQVAAGLWQLRLSQGYRQRIPPLQILRDNRHHPEDRLSGMIQPDAAEAELPSLEHLKTLAQ